MASQPERRALHAFVSDEAHAKWHEFAAEQGVSVSALLEALGTHVIGSSSEALDMSDALVSVVGDARRIDAERRRRRPSG